MIYGKGQVLIDCCWDEFIYCSINADETRSRAVTKKAAHTANLHDMSLGKALNL